MRALRREIVFVTAPKPAAAPEIWIKSAQCLLVRHPRWPLLGQSHLGGRRPQLAGCSPSRSGPRVDLRAERLACQPPLWAKRV